MTVNRTAKAPGYFKQILKESGKSGSAICETISVEGLREFAGQILDRTRAAKRSWPEIFL